MLYTIMDMETVMAEPEEGLHVVKTIDGVTISVIPLQGGKGAISQLISTDPMHYLDPKFAPGTQVDIDTKG